VCTLVIGRDVVASGTTILGANRDESPSRPSHGPGLLLERPRLVGGRDLTAGGTWLAIREREAVVAILNRWDPHAAVVPGAELRSRGLLVLDVAVAGSPHAALDAIRRARYAPFSLIFATASEVWMIVHDGARAARLETIGRGWHAITHRDLDDRAEPRTARVQDELAQLAPRSADEAIDGVAEVLRLHGEGGPPICLHEGRMVTVSSSIVWMASGEMRYRHAEGRPCVVPYADHHALLGPSAGVS
jgi:uncharacterized protein with NRDE domain